MASCQTTQWVSSAPYVKLTVTESASTGSTSTLSWTLQYIASYAASTNSARSYSVVIAGATVKSGTYSINGVTGTHTIASGTKVINKTTSTQSISFSVSFAFNLTWSGSYKGTLSASGSYSVPAKTSYTIKYNANGGSGAPSSQTKWYGTALTLSSTKPTRTGHSFNKWNTASNGTGTSYNSGASYTANAAATLYAQWTANKYTVTYNANGGSGAPAAQTKTYGVALTLSSTKPTRSGYTFKGWGTSASSTTVAYAAGASYTNNASITLYAIWTKSYTKPSIYYLSVNRCNSSGTVDDSGTYILVKSSWSTRLSVSSIKIGYKTPAETSYTYTTVSASGTRGDINSVVGDGAINVDNSYDVVLVVEDSGGSTSKTSHISGTSFIIDILADGKGIAFGKAAEKSGYADFEYIGKFRNHMDLTNDKSIRGVTVDDQVLNMLGLSAYNNIILGYGGYSAGVGVTNIYGNKLQFFTKDPTATWKPYYSKGDSITVNIFTAGYVVNSGTDVYFTVPIAKPIVGSPTASAASGSNFKLMQNGKYTHGSSASANAAPSVYTVSIYNTHIGIKVRFSNATNAVNCAPVGVLWNGTITFS